MDHGEQFFNSSGGGVSEYQIERSLRFNSADSAYLSRTPASAGNRKTWTWAGWVKRSGLGVKQDFFSAYSTSNDAGTFNFNFNSSDQIAVDAYNFNFLVTTQVFRDTSAWYHIVLAFDSTQATANNRIRLYVNGLEITAFNTRNNPVLNTDYGINAAGLHRIGANSFSLGTFTSGYLADCFLIDGQALDPTSFGEFDTNGVWQPKAYSGTYGTNGFHLPFNDNSTAAALGTDTSGNGNTWTVNNISVAAGAGNDSLVDSPTNYGADTGVGNEVRGNYATLNPLDKGANVTLTNGNLDFSVTVSNGSVPSTIGMSSGKWYYEMTMTASSGNTLGLVKSGYNTASYVGSDSLSWGYNASNGQKYTGGSGSSYGATFTNGDVIGIAFDADAGTLVFYKNGSSQGTAYTGLTSGPYFFAVGGGSSSGSLNFGQRPFAYAAPTGFKALCTQNLPDPTIADGSTAMDVVTYTGNGSTQTISGLGFSPDLVWLKSRSDTYSHNLYDVIRGANNALFSDTTDATITHTDRLSSFNSDGFTLGAGTAVNGNNLTFAAWTWDAGSSTVTNTDGSITSQVRANPSAGFSIVSWTGNGVNNETLGHGLAVRPSMIIAKRREASHGWYIWTDMLTKATANVGISFTTDPAALYSYGHFSSLNSSTVTLSQGSTAIDNVNTLNASYIAYCFAPVESYSAFGSYTGNGSADGPFVYTGFRPRWVMLKNVSAATSWQILDSARDIDNPEVNRLRPNVSDAEVAGFNTLDGLSNGFKIRDSAVAWNANGNTYIYAAFAENPFKTARAR